MFSANFAELGTGSFFPFFSGISAEEGNIKRVCRNQTPGQFSRTEGIIPAVESAHAVAYAMKLAKEIHTGSILVCLSGRGDKDVDYVIEHYGYGDDHKFED